MNEPLLTDDLAALLAQFPGPDLHSIVSILKHATSWSIFPSSRAYEAHDVAPGGDLQAHVPAIAREILWWGSNDLQRQIGRQPDWRAIVADVARQVGVEREERATGAPAWRVERALVLKALHNWEALDPERRADIVKEAGATFGAVPGGLAAVGSAAAQFGGLRLAALLPAKLGAGVMLAPVVLALGVAWSAHELAGPGYRVLRPVTLGIALTRLRLRDERAAATFGETA